MAERPCLASKEDRPEGFQRKNQGTVKFDEQNSVDSDRFGAAARALAYDP